MRAAIINSITNVVVNVIELDPNSTWQPSQGFFVHLDQNARIGQLWDGEGLIDPETPPPAPTPVPTSITTRQFLIAAAVAGIITQAEAVAAATNGAVPASIQAVFDSLPSDEAFAAQITWAKMTIVPRVDPLVAAVALSLSMTTQQMDDFFIQAATL